MVDKRPDPRDPTGKNKITNVKKICFAFARRHLLAVSFPSHRNSSDRDGKRERGRHRKEKENEIREEEDQSRLTVRSVKSK